MKSQTPDSLKNLLAEVRSCRICAEHLPLGPRPVLVAAPTARVLIVGQAPGTKVHESGIPWNDRSGDRLRDWMCIDTETFYDPARIAIVPTGFCYPGRDPKGGDLPPRPECAPAWHPRIMPFLKRVRLTLVVGGYAQAVVLGDKRLETMTETVANWREYGPKLLPLPHPSWRTMAWERKNPWFGDELLPHLKACVRSELKENP